MRRKSFGLQNGSFCGRHPAKPLKAKGCRHSERQLYGCGDMNIRLEEVLMAVVTTAVSTLIAYLFHRAAKNFARLSYTYISGLIATKRLLIEETSILYQGKPVSRLAGCFFYIWNSGTVPIRREAIAAADPIRVASEDQACEILNVEILNVSRPVTNFSASYDPRAQTHKTVGLGLTS
jgi:hypothetical protein